MMTGERKEVLLFLNGDLWKLSEDSSLCITSHKKIEIDKDVAVEVQPSFWFVEKTYGKMK